MEPILKSDVFFFITSVAVVILSIVILIALYYLIKILRNVEDLSDKVKGEGERIIDDIDGVRRSIKKQGARVRKIISPTSSKRGKK